MLEEPKLPLKVFLCHAHSDRDKVRDLYLRLRREGVDVWLDKEKLLPGSDWEYEIRKAVREADVVVVCLSMQFNQAGFRQKEVRIALDAAIEKPEGEIFIIPARLEECDNLESLRKWHWVDLFDEDGYHNLIRALRAQADKIDATLRLRNGGQSAAPRQKIKKPVARTPKTINSEEKKTKPPRSVAIHSQQEPISEKPRRPSKWNKPFKAAMFSLTGLIIIALIGSSFLKNLLSLAPTKLVPTSTRTATNIPHALVPTSPTLALKLFVATPYSGSLPIEITDTKGAIMRLVPAGEFRMGGDVGNPKERLAHQVYLDAYYID